MGGNANAQRVLAGWRRQSAAIAARGGPVDEKTLKRQRGKVSKANKLTCSAEKKAITKKLKAVRAEQGMHRRGGLLEVAAAAAAAAPACPEPGGSSFAGFVLPSPQ